MNICSLILYISFSYLYHNDQKLAENINNIWFGDMELNQVFTPQYHSDKELFAILDKIKTNSIEIAEDPIEETQLSDLSLDNQEIFIEDDIESEELNTEIKESALDQKDEISMLDNQEIFIEDDIKENIIINEDNSDIPLYNQEQDEVSNLEVQEELITDLNEDEFIIEDLTIKDEGSEIEIKAKEIIDSDKNLSAQNKTEDIIVEEMIPNIMTENNKELDVVTIESNNKFTEEYNRVYQEIAGPTLLEIETVLEDRRLETLFNKIQAYKKPDTNYKILYKAKILNQKSYNAKNKHLDKVFFYEQYFPTLYTAIKEGNIEVITSLTDSIGINNNILVKGEEPFIYAIKLGNINVIRKMLHLGYNPDIRDKNGNAPIHLAILANRVDIVTELIKFKANIALPNKNYIRPMKLALNNKNYFIANILSRAGAKNIDTHKTFSDYLRSSK